MDDRELVAQFEARTLKPGHFGHEAHVRVAWIYLSENPLPEAMIRFRDGLRAYASSLGKTSLYNETITFGFLLLIHDRLRRFPTQPTWQAFRAANADLLSWSTNPLKELYGEEVLNSDLAKRFFILPEQKSCLV